MFFIFGWNHPNVTEYGPVQQEKCGNCHNTDLWQLKKISKYFTLFFIPIFPHDSVNLYHCPICNYGLTLEGEDFEDYKAIANVNTACLEKRISEEERLNSLEDIHKRMQQRQENSKSEEANNKWTDSASKITNEELEAILASKPGDYDPGYINAAQAEVKRRKARGW